MPYQHSQCYDIYAPLSAVRSCIEDGHAVLVIMRGVPGTGKSSLAKDLCINGGVIASTDDLFYRNGIYLFEQDKLSEYHKKNQLKARSAMEDFIKPVIIDNTNISVADFKPYILHAVKQSYEIYIVEPDNPWKNKPGQCARRNEHGVPKERILNMMDLLHSEGRPPFHKLVAKDVVVNIEMPDVLEDNDIKERSAVSISLPSFEAQLQNQEFTSLKTFSLAPVFPTVLEKTVRDFEAQVNDVGILLSTLGRDESQINCFSAAESPYQRQYLENASKLIKTNDRPAPSVYDSMLLPSKDEHWLDFLLTVFPLVDCSELLHIYQLYGLQNTLDILFERREQFISSDYIFSGSFSHNYNEITMYEAPLMEQTSNATKFANQEDANDSANGSFDEYLTVDISSMQLVLNEEFGSDFPTLIKLPRHVIQSIVKHAEFFTAEAMLEAQLQQDNAYALQVAKELEKDLERQRISEQTARLFPEARHENYLVSYTVPAFEQQQLEKQSTSGKNVCRSLTLEEAQQQAQKLIEEADLLDYEIKELQLRVSEMNKKNPAASAYHREQLSSLMRKRNTLREDGDSLIRDANNNSDNRSFIDLHYMTLEGARKYVKEQILTKSKKRKRLRIVTGHANGSSVIKNQVLNDVKNMSNNRWTVDTTSNAGEIAITFF